MGRSGITAWAGGSWVEGSTHSAEDKQLSAVLIDWHMAAKDRHSHARTAHSAARASTSPTPTRTTKESGSIPITHTSIVGHAQTSHPRLLFVAPQPAQCPEERKNGCLDTDNKRRQMSPNKLQRHQFEATP